MCYHTPVLLKESIDGLGIKPGGTYIDMTYGGGGHSGEILKRLTEGKLIAFDQDSDVLDNVISDKRLILINHNYRFFKNFLRHNGIGEVDGILADLGVSSHQIDIPQRGFSYRFSGNLDMRMNTGSKFTACDLLNDYPVRQLIRVFSEYGEIRNSKRLADMIEEYRTAADIKTTEHLIEAISACIPKNRENSYLSKVFQALRIEVNSEMDALKEMLLQTTDTIIKGGRLVIITYHSLEDRLVKNFIKNGKPEGEVEKDIYGNAAVPFRAVNNKIITAGEAEVKQNVRARSAKLRIAEKII